MENQESEDQYVRLDANILSGLKMQNADSALSSTLRMKIFHYQQLTSELEAQLKIKDKAIHLFEKEKVLLEKEKQTLESRLANLTNQQEKFIVRYATKEKAIIDFQKERDSFDKKMSDYRQDIQTITMKNRLLSEEKAKLLVAINNKCCEIKKLTKENEKLKSNYSILEAKIKSAPVPITRRHQHLPDYVGCEDDVSRRIFRAETSVGETLKTEYEASIILLKHENETKNNSLLLLKKEYDSAIDALKSLTKQLAIDKDDTAKLVKKAEIASVATSQTRNMDQTAVSQGANLRAEVEILKGKLAENLIIESKSPNERNVVKELKRKIKTHSLKVQQWRSKEVDLLNTNKEMSELMVRLQNELYLESSKYYALKIENERLKHEKDSVVGKQTQLERRLAEEVRKKNEEILLLSIKLSRRTKQHESVMFELEKVMQDKGIEKGKQTQIYKERQRDLSKLRENRFKHRKLRVNTGRTSL